MEPSTWILLILGLVAAALPLAIGARLVLDVHREGKRIDKIMQAEFPSRLMEESVKR